MIKSIAKRLLPLFLVLVVMISLFPAVPASAEDVAPAADCTISGVWLINDYIPGESAFSSINQNVLFTSNGQAFSSMSITRQLYDGPVVLHYVNIKYNSVSVHDLSWANSAYRTVDFGSTPQTVSSSFYNWFVSNATQQTSSEFVYSVNIDGKSMLTYSSTEESVNVELWVGECGYICYFADNQNDGCYFDYELDDDQVFLGMSELASSQNPYYKPNEDEPYIIKLNSSISTLNLYGIFGAAPDPDSIYYTHTIQIDNSSFDFSAENAAPPVTIQVTSNGCSLTSTDGSVVKSWTYSGTDTFIGIKASDGSVYNVGAYFSVLGLTGADKTSAFSVLTEFDPDPDPDPEPSETYTHTIIIDGSSYVFDGETGAPPITFDVRDDYVILISGGQQKTWYYQGSGTFLGIRNTATGELHGPAAWFSLLGSNGWSKTSRFTVEVAAPESDPTYYNTIYIDGVPYQLSGIGFSPDVQLTVQENGCILTSGSTSLTYLYSGTGTFTGLSFVAGTDPNLPIGTVIIIDGSSSGNSSIKLYACFDEVLPDQDEDFQGGVLGWLKYLSEKIRDLPGDIAEKMASAALPAPLQFIFSIFDFDSLRIFFVDMYQNVTSVFGLRTLIEDPAGPFAWLMAS